jgi:hypothetical protein
MSAHVCSAQRAVKRSEEEWDPSVSFWCNSFLSLSHDAQRETEFLRFEMWAWTEAGIRRRLLWHELSRSCGMENGGEQQQYFHKTFENFPRIGHIFCSRCYVRYVLLLLLKQSIIAQYFHKPF